MYQNFLKQTKIYKPEEIGTVLDLTRSDMEIVKTGRKKAYYNIPVSFDIETSSFYKYGEKQACMYEWSFCFNGLVIIGRTWKEFILMCQNISDRLQLSENLRLIIYVHNLAYEFQFMRKWFSWSKVFAVKSRTPVYALTDTGIEFRCSLILSGYKLEKVGENLHKYKVAKLIGDLDYTLMRHSKTPLTEKEIGYCVNDVKVVTSYIQELIDELGGIHKIPLTKTGFVRRFCRSKCLPEDNASGFKRYADLIRSLTLDSEEYRQLKRAFQGGFTHANPFYSGKLLHDVTSFDFTSSYPTVMLCEKFPMSRCERVTIRNRDDLVKNLHLYCCLFDVTFYGLESTIIADNYISLSRCWVSKNTIINNGRVVSADKLSTTITEQDFFIIRKFYTWKKIKIFNFKRYKKDYLPTSFIKSILELYGNKTKLKGVDGKEVEYQHSKEMLNSCYGMSVTDIIRTENIYESDTWTEKNPDLEKGIFLYNNNKARFLFYPWGVWITAYARKNLFTGILACQDDYIYSDTDSIKVLHGEKHQEYINGYNKEVVRKLDLAMKQHKIGKAKTAPETIKGVKKQIGVWDFDGLYSDFKTLGAKRYAVKYADQDINGSAAGRYSITVSGVNKKVCVPWLLDTFGESGFFDAFTDQLYIPEDFSGKMTHTYIDDEARGVLTDYLGMPGQYYEKSAVHLSKSDYSLSLSQEYIDYLLRVQEEEY